MFLHQCQIFYYYYYYYIKDINNIDSIKSNPFGYITLKSNNRGIYRKRKMTQGRIKFIFLWYFKKLNHKSSVCAVINEEVLSVFYCLK